MLNGSSSKTQRSTKKFFKSWFYVKKSNSRRTTDFMSGKKSEIYIVFLDIFFMVNDILCIIYENVASSGMNDICNRFNIYYSSEYIRTVCDTKEKGGSNTSKSFLQQWYILNFIIGNHDEINSHSFCYFLLRKIITIMFKIGYYDISDNRKI